MNSVCQVDPSIPAEVLDPQTLAKLGQLDPTGQSRLVQRVLSTYLQSLARLRLQISGGIDPAKLAAVRLGAHTLKSSSASIGALQLSALCAAVEQAIRDGNHDALTTLIPQMQSEVDRVDDAVNSLLAH